MSVDPFKYNCNRYDCKKTDKSNVHRSYTKTNPQKDSFVFQAESSDGVLTYDTYKKVLKYLNEIIKNKQKNLNQKRLDSNNVSRAADKVFSSFGAGSKKIENEIEENKKQLQSLKDSSEKLPVVYKKITGRTLCKDEIKRITDTQKDINTDKSPDSSNGVISFGGSNTDLKKDIPSQKTLRELSEAELAFAQSFGPDEENVKIIKFILQRLEYSPSEEDLNDEEFKGVLNSDFFENAKKRNLTGEKYEEYEADDLVSFAIIDDDTWEKANSRGLIEQCLKTYGLDIEFFTQIEGEKWQRAQNLFSIKNRQPSFAGYQIEKIVNLDEKEYEKAQKMFYIPERKNEQIDGYSISNIAKLNDEEFKKASNLFYIPERKKQFSGDDILKLAECDEEKINFLSFIPKREQQFEVYEICGASAFDKDLLINIDIDKLKKLAYIEGRDPDKQFRSYDIQKLAKLENEKLDKLLYIPGRKKDQFDVYSIQALGELEPDQWEKAQKFLFVENRIRQFNEYDIKKLIAAGDKEMENIEKRNLLTIKNGGKDLKAEDILNFSNWEDEAWNNILKSGMLKEKVYRSANELRCFNMLDENSWKLIKKHGLLNIEGREKQLSANDIHSLTSPVRNSTTNISRPLKDEEWQAIFDRKLLINKFGRLEYLSGNDVKELACADEESWNIIKKRGLLNIEKRGEYNQFSAKDIIILSNLNDKEWENVEKRNLIDRKKDNTFFYNAYDIKEFALMDDKQWEKAIQRQLLDSRFQARDIRILSNLNDKEWENVEKRNLINRKDRHELYDAQDIIEFALMDDKQWEKIQERSLLNMKERIPFQFNAKEIKLLLGLEDKQWDKAKERNLFGEYYTDYTQLSAEQIIKYTLMDDKTWEQMQNIRKLCNTHFDTIETLFSIQENINSIGMLNLREKIWLYSFVQNNEKILANNGINVEICLDVLNKSTKQTINPVPVSDEQKKKFFTGIMANNNPGVENFIKTADFKNFGKEGLPLKYSRKEFIEDLSMAIKNLNESEKRNIFKLIAIDPFYNSDGDIEGYDGILDISKLDKNNPVQENIYNLIHKFIYENSAANDDSEMNNFIDSLIAGIPEFINIIGKKQHTTHDFSLDIHILQVLQECLKNPAYNELGTEDKTVLKMTVLLHDIAKKENIVDKGHQITSALYARNIMDKFFGEYLKDRTFEMIKNHHWLEEFNTGKISFDKLAVNFRRYDDFTIAKIIAQSDLKGVNENFYNNYAYAIEKAKPVEDSLKKIYQSGNFIFTTPNIKNWMLPKIYENEREYKVLNLTQLDDSEDMGQYGFIPGVKKQDLRFLVHMLPQEKLAQAAKTVDDLSDVANGGVLSTSLLSMDAQRTYGNRKYGFILDTNQDNIANAYPSNQGSGYEKGIEKFSSLSTGNNEFRTYLRNMVCQNLDLSEKEYAQIYKKLLSKKYYTQIKNDDLFQAGDKSVSGAQLKEAIKEAQDSLLDKTEQSHNEIVAYNPKIKAVICKVNSFDNVPDEIKDFAYSHNLPIFLTGNRQ